jgi:hypothetical protein
MQIVRHRQGLPCAVRFLQRRDQLLVRQKSEPHATAHAGGILEIERLPAILAFEKLHAVTVTRQ